MPSTPESNFHIIKQTFGPISASEIKFRADIRGKVAASKRRSQLSSALSGADPLKALNLTPREIVQNKLEGDLKEEPFSTVRRCDDVSVDVWDCLTLCGKVRHFVESQFGL